MLAWRRAFEETSLMNDRLPGSRLILGRWQMLRYRVVGGAWKRPSHYSALRYSTVRPTKAILGSEAEDHATSCESDASPSGSLAFAHRHTDPVNAEVGGGGGAELLPPTLGARARRRPDPEPQRCAGHAWCPRALGQIVEQAAGLAEADGGDGRNTSQQA